MALPRFTQQSHDELDYDTDGFRWLTTDDLIVSASASYVCLNNPDDTALVVNDVSVGDTYVKVWLSGGTVDSVYKITVAIQTDGGRNKEKEFTLTIKDV